MVRSNRRLSGCTSTRRRCVRSRCLPLPRGLRRSDRRARRSREPAPWPAARGAAGDAPLSAAVHRLRRARSREQRELLGTGRGGARPTARRAGAATSRGRTSRCHRAGCARRRVRPRRAVRVRSVAGGSRHRPRVCDGEGRGAGEPRSAGGPTSLSPPTTSSAPLSGSRTGAANARDRTRRPRAEAGAPPARRVVQAARCVQRVLSEPAVPPSGLIVASGGNHGAAVAFVGRSLGVPVESACRRRAPPSNVTRSNDSERERWWWRATTTTPSARRAHGRRAPPR